MNIQSTLTFLCLFLVAFLTWDSHVKTSELLQQKNDVIRELSEHIKKQSEMIDRYTNETNRIDASNREVKEELERMKGRTNTLLKKPEVVEALINKSFNTFEERFSCVTGNDALCSVF